MEKKFLLRSGWKLCLALLLFTSMANASSHREAPLISNDPLADNTDVYAFRSPDDPSKLRSLPITFPFNYQREDLIITILVLMYATKFTLKTKLPLRATILPIVLHSRQLTRIPPHFST